MVHPILSPFFIVTSGMIAFYVAIFSVWLDYDVHTPVFIPGYSIQEDPRVIYYYKPFMDVSIMVFIGFGYLMTFLRKYPFSAVGYTFFISCFVIPWAIICNIFFTQIADNRNVTIYNIDLPDLIEGLFASASAMITFGVVIGRATPFQLLVIAIIQIPFYSFNSWVGLEKFNALDIGGSMLIHVFGAYYGVAISLIMGKAETRNHPEMGSTQISDTFSLIGTIWLWICWPSFNSASAPASRQLRTIINTFFSLCGSCLATFLCSYVFKKGKFGIIDIQNATLAGGVGVGSAADLVITPGGAFGVGLGAGLLSTFGFNFIQPFLLKVIKLQDTCGVHNLHGMPGVYAGIVSIIATGIYYDNKQNSTLFVHGSQQALYQFFTLMCTIGVGLFAGIIAGVIVRFLPHPKEPFDDKEFWTEGEGDKYEGTNTT